MPVLPVPNSPSAPTVKLQPLTATNVDTATTNTTTQTNTADLNNNLQLSANTGGNSASYNTGGSNGILTGDAQIIANLVNFVNNNITGGGRLVVSVVNVFGSWLGDFVTSGQKKTPNPDLPVTAQSENISNPVSEPAVGGADLQESSAPTTAPAISVLTSQTPSNPGQTATIKSGIRRLLGRKPGVFAIDSESKPDALIASFTAGDLRDVIITPAPSGLSRKIIHINLADYHRQWWRIGKQYCRSVGIINKCPAGKQYRCGERYQIISQYRG